MLKRLLIKVKEGLYKVGIIKGLKDLNSHKKIELSDEHYDKIGVWKSLYMGYNSDIHDYYENSIAYGRRKKRRLSLNMPKVISGELANLIFNEKCSINIGTADDNLKKFVLETFKDNRFNAEFQRFLEYAYALGGLIIKVYLKNNNAIGINFVNADSFIPLSWDNAKINEGVFVEEQIKGKYKYTHLEWHLWENQNYVVYHEVYKSDKNTDELGIKILINELYPGLQEKVVIRNLKQPLFTYIKTNTANNIDLSSPLGISIYHNSFDVLKAIDIAYDSFEREFRLGRKRILVPSSAIRTVVDDAGNFKRYFDATDETYESFSSGTTESGIQDIKDISVELRVEEHISAINALLNLLAMQTGFSPGAFTFDGKQGIKTATEVVSENSKTFRNKQSHEILVETALIELVNIIVDFGQLYNLITIRGDYEVTVTFDDSIAQDRNQDAQYFISLVSSGLLSKKRAIMKLYGISAEESEEILKEIIDENNFVSNDNIDFLGMSDE